MTQHPTYPHRRRFVAVFAGLAAATALAASAPAQAPTTAPAATAPVGGTARTGTAPSTTAPTTRGTLRPMRSDAILNRMLAPGSAAQPLQPLPTPPAVDATSGQGTLAPRAPQVRLAPEGTYLTERWARLTQSPDGRAQLSFESDGSALGDPPMLVLPNRLLTSMESRVKGGNTPTRWRISGMITEYGDRNYILIDRATPEDRQ
jgi:hypothetical protein